MVGEWSYGLTPSRERIDGYRHGQKVADLYGAMINQD